MRFNLLSSFTSHVIILVCASCYSQACWCWLLNQWQHRFQKKDAMSFVEPPAPTPHCNSNAEPSIFVEQTKHQTNIESNINSLRLRQNDRICSRFSEILSWMAKSLPGSRMILAMGLCMCISRPQWVKSHSYTLNNFSENTPRQHKFTKQIIYNILVSPAESLRLISELSPLAAQFG